MERKKRPHGYGTASGVTITMTASGTEGEAAILLSVLEEISRKIEEDLGRVGNTAAKTTHSDI